MRVRLSLRQPKSTGPKEKIDWKYFSSRPELQDQYTMEVVNRFQPLGEEEEGEEEVSEEEEDVRNVGRRGVSATMRYQHFIEANSKTMKSLTKVKRGKKSRHSNHPDVVEARKKVEGSHEKYIRGKSDELKDSLKAAQAQLFKVYDRLREEELEGKISEVEATSDRKRHGEAWKIVSEISGRRKSKAS